jgi:shikimate dehydrogenase
MPLKEAVLGLGEVDPVARRAGGGNTLILDGPRRRVYNTDVPGLVWRSAARPPWRCPGSPCWAPGPQLAPPCWRSTELGAAAVTVVARTPARAEALAALGRELGLQVAVRPWTADLPRPTW